MRDEGTLRDLPVDLWAKVESLRAEQAGRAASVPISLVGGDCLTERQREVVSLVVTGASNSEIARALGTSSKTVRNHLVAIQRKTGTRNRTHLAAVAGRAQVQNELRLRAAV